MLKNKIMIVFLVLFQTIVIFAQSETNQLNNLNALQQITVTIGGSFPVTGSFVASSNERVDQFITRVVGLFSKENKIATIDKYATRNIKLKRKSGEEFILDLAKFRALGEFSNNPYLKNEDVLVFPNLDIERNYFVIDGAVNNQTKFLYVKGDKLKDALVFAQGFSEAYTNIKGFEILRFNQSNGKEEVIEVSKDNLDFEIKVADRIKVVAEKPYIKDIRVLVFGEVNNPGYIPISYNATSVYEAIKRAGGLKDEADLDNIDLIRNSGLFYSYKTNINMNFDDYYLNKLQLTQIQNANEVLELNRMSYLLPEDSTSFQGDVALKFRNSTFPITRSEIQGDSVTRKLQEGDVILVHKKNNYVYVFGQVNKVGYIPYEEGKDFSYYIQKSDGLGSNSRNEIYVINGKTKKWTLIKDDYSSPKIERGDLIWVAKGIRRDIDYYYQRVGQVTSIIGAVATTLLLILQFTK